MTEPDFEAVGRYHAYLDQFDAVTAQRNITLKALKRWSATTETGKRNLMKLSLDDVDDYVRQLHQQQEVLTQLAKVINPLAHDLDKPGVRFVAHQVL